MHKSVMLRTLGLGQSYFHGPFTRCVKLWVAHAPGMSGTFFPPPQISDPDMHHGTYVTHVPCCMPGSLTSGFPWSWWRGKRSRHSLCMRNLQFCVSGKRPMCSWINIRIKWVNNSHESLPVESISIAQQNPVHISCDILRPLILEVLQNNST